VTDNSIQRDLWRQVFNTLVAHNYRVAWSNSRFLIGMWIGGFSEATRGSLKAR